MSLISLGCGGWGRAREREKGGVSQLTEVWRAGTDKPIGQQAAARVALLMDGHLDRPE